MKSRDFLNILQRDFLLNEGVAGINSYIQSLTDVLSTFTPRTVGDSRRLEVARENLLNVKRHVKRLEEKISILEEENTVLKEKKIRKR